MVPQARAGSFSPNPAQSLQTGPSHSPLPAQPGAFSAAASPSTNSPTGVNSLTKIVVAQVYLLLSTIKEDKDRTKWEVQADQLRKLIDDHGMEVYSKYFTRLVAGNAPTIFPGLNRPSANSGNYHLLVAEMHKLTKEIDHVYKIAESIEAGTEDIFRDFDLQTFLDHFGLDALQKTVLALAFKTGSRADLKAKADAILSANFPAFVDHLSKPEGSLKPEFLPVIIDRFIQNHPPTFNSASKAELVEKIHKRYPTADEFPPAEVLAALDLIRVLGDKVSNALALYIQRTGPDFTRDEAACTAYLLNRPKAIQLSGEQIANALTYTTISRSVPYDPSIIVASLRSVVSPTLLWQDVVSHFDQRTSRISSTQFLRLYKALLPIAKDDPFTCDIQHLWGGNWENPETQLSFISAFASLGPEELDASTIPGLRATISPETYAQSKPAVKARAAVAVRHPLVSVAAMSAIFHVALNSLHASETVEAKRLFQRVVVPNLDIFFVSAFGVPKPWPTMAIETLNSLFGNFLHKSSDEHEFVLDSLWKKDKEWVVQRLIDAHVVKPLDLPIIFEHASNHGWLEDLVYLPAGFGLDLAALAHAEGVLDLSDWARTHASRGTEIARPLLQFLMIKSNLELSYQRTPEDQNPVKTHTTLQVRTVAPLIQILEDFLPKAPVPDLILVQRACITAYPRLINYGEGFDDIIDENGRNGNNLPAAANAKMEEHYKKMYGDEMQVKDIVLVLSRYKRSRDPLDQEVFACMIHGLFDEYTHYVGYPLEALATTAVLFGGIISHKLISDLPLKVGLGMILESVRDHGPEDAMFKFGLQALMQLFARLDEWPGFCTQLIQIPGLHGTEAWNIASDIVRDHDEDTTRNRQGGLAAGLDSSEARGTSEGGETLLGGERHHRPFEAIKIDPPNALVEFEEPTVDAQGKVQFVLNNLTESTVAALCKELQTMVDIRNQQWLACHLVEERAKMQPNYHLVYLELVKLFDDKILWSEVLRETYTSVRRLLNSEATIHNSTERTHLKNLGAWLGLLTIARDKPIRQRNIAFRQLLMEGLDSKRLMVVIPFVCKVLIQGSASTIFRPPNPWLMDLINLLIELYHNAELKLNLKFEIEVLCKGLNLDHKSIEPSGELLKRATEEVIQLTIQDGPLEAFDNMALNGIGPGVGSALNISIPAPTIPDLSPMIHIPPTNEMVISTSRLHELVRTALTRAIQDIIQPVVERSVAIAAISASQIIRKDFATEPDENRVRNCAISMVKATAGSLALVTSKEPLRANFTNYLRNHSNDLPQGLPEGTVIMCVNSNIDLACGIIEKQAEEKAVPEIEEMIESDLEARRRHRATRPNEPFMDSSLSRWAWTIPNPYKLSPSMHGLNTEQMAIYEEFARQPRASTTSGPSHAPSASDATRSLAAEGLQEQFSSLPNPPTPAETPSLQHLNGQLQAYPTIHSNPMANGNRGPAVQVDVRVVVERVQKLLVELQRVAAEAVEEHFVGLPRPHPVLDVVDALVQLIIKSSQNSEEFAVYTAEQVCQLIFSQVDDNLALESLVHVLETLRRIGGRNLNGRVDSLFSQQPAHMFLNLPLLAALLRTELLDWQQIDVAMSSALQQRKEGSLDFLEHLLDLTLLNSRPLVFYSDFLQTLEVAWTWLCEEPSSNVAAQRLKAKMKGIGAGQQPPRPADGVPARQEQMEYVFDEWVRLYRHPAVTEKASLAFIRQAQCKKIIGNKDDLLIFIRVAIDVSVENFDQSNQSLEDSSEEFFGIDALGNFLALVVRSTTDSELGGEGGLEALRFLDALLAFVTLVLNHHHVTRGDAFPQRVFFRLYSAMFHEASALSAALPEPDRPEVALVLAKRLRDLDPKYVPGFLFGWLSLIQHRSLFPALLQAPNRVGWAPYAKLVCQLLRFIGDQLKNFEVAPPVKELYRAIVKLMLVLQHDFPEFVAAYSIRFCNSIPTHCTQLLGTILAANPVGLAKMADSNILDDRAEGMRELPLMVDDSATILRENGLLEVVDMTLRTGPSEDAVAHIARAITRTDNVTSFGHVPVGANAQLISAVVVHIGNRTAQKSGPLFVPGSPEVTTLMFLVREMPAETRYYILSTMVNQLRFPNAHTTFYSQLLLAAFSGDPDDPEDADIRQQIVRILLERLVGYWPQPWGLMLMVFELVKNDKYMFFKLPFIKNTPEVAERFAMILQRA